MFILKIVNEILFLLKRLFYDYLDIWETQQLMSRVIYSIAGSEIPVIQIKRDFQLSFSFLRWWSQKLKNKIPN